MTHKEEMIDILDDSFVTYEEPEPTTLMLDTTSKGVFVELEFDRGGMLLRCHIRGQAQRG